MVVDCVEVFWEVSCVEAPRSLDERFKRVSQVPRSLVLSQDSRRAPLARPELDNSRARGFFDLNFPQRFLKQCFCTKNSVLNLPLAFLFFGRFL